MNTKHASCHGSLRCRTLRRFGTTFLGSRAMAGTLLSSGMLEAADKDGASLAEVLAVHGFNASAAAIAKIAAPREHVRG